MSKKRQEKSGTGDYSGRRKKWADSDMVSAMRAVKMGQLTVSAAAIKFSVPRKTLDDRIKGRIKHGSKPGVSTALSSIEEDSLVSYLIYMANRGFPLTRTMVKAFAWSIAKRCGTSNRFNSEYGPGEKWWVSFRQRHPQLALRRCDSLERSRAEALSPAIVNEYYDLLYSVLDDNGLLNSPRQIYNCDETFVPLDFSREKAVTVRGVKNVYRQSQGTSDHITMLCCASAAGFPLPPMIIYSKSFPGGQYRFDGPDDTLYAKSESGWIDTELFITWFKKIFLKYSVAQRPLLLLIDGHKSHMGLELVDLCRENNVILFCLPPHTTHALQPLDVSVFKSLKDHFAKAVRSITFAKKDYIVTKRDFSRVIKSPFEKAFSIPNIKAGFAKCGVYPFNRNAVPIEKMIPSVLHKSSLSVSSGSSSDSPRSSSCDLHPGSSPSEICPDQATPPTASSVSSSPGVVPASSTPCVSPMWSTPCVSPMSCVVPVSSTPTCVSASTSATSVSPTSTNPLVMAGIIPADMADILTTPLPDAAMIRKRTKRITGARDLTANEYRDMLLEEKRRKEDLEQQKIQRIEERKRKKQEREEKKKEVAMRKNVRQRKGKKGVGKGKEKVQQQSVGTVESSDSDSDAGVVTAPRRQFIPSVGESSSSRPRRQTQVPSRFRSGSDSDNNDGTICTICGSNEPEGLGDEIVFWIDCSNCGEWAHNLCAFGKNTITRQYICNNC